MKLFLFASPLLIAAQPLVQSVRFEGAAMQPALETRAGEPLDPAAVSRDFRALWSTGRFDDLCVERRGSPESPEIVFRAVPKASFALREVKIKGDAGPKPAVAPEATIDTLSAHQAAVALKHGLSRDGYREAEVRASIVPVGDGQADLVLKVERGRRFRVDRVEFSGELGLPAGELRRALHATRPRVRIPWLWTDRPGDSEDAVQADAARLRALYASRGYFDAEVAVSRMTVPDGRVALRYRVDAGRLYRIGEVRVGETLLPEGNDWTRRLCGCLFEARHRAWAEGRMEFGARIDAAEGAGGLALHAGISTGPPYTLGRIEFQGHHSYSDSTLRRAMNLAEGDPFDWNRVYRSLRRINELQLFQPLTERSLRITQDPARGRANLTVSLQERPRRLWSISGPVGPASLSGPFTASVAARLPKFGRGVLETSTYYAAFGFTGLSPLARLLPLLPKGARLSASLSRPYLPDQEWVSGFSISPQWGWKAVLLNYGLTQAGRRTRAWLAGKGPEEAIIVPVAFGRAPVLLCESPAPRLRWLRAAAGIAMDWLLPGF